MSLIEIFDKMPQQQQDRLAQKHGVSRDQVRKLFEKQEEEKTWHVPRSKADKKLLDNIKVGEIIDMPFAKQTKQK